MNSKRQQAERIVAVRKPHCAGLTLLELIVVLVILAALAGMVIPQLTGTNKQAALAVTAQSMKQLQTLISNRYYVDMLATSTASLSGGVLVVSAGPAIPGLPSANVADATRVVNPQIQFLFFNPLSYSSGHYYANPSTTYSSTGMGWNGPYLLSGVAGTYPDSSVARPSDPSGQTWGSLGYTSTYGLPGDATIVDAWGGPIVIQLPPLQPTDDPTHAERYARLVSGGSDGAISTNASIPYPSVSSCGDDIVVYLFAPDLRP